VAGILPVVIQYCLGEIFWSLRAISNEKADVILSDIGFLSLLAVS